MLSEWCEVLDSSSMAPASGGLAEVGDDELDLRSMTVESSFFCFFSRGCGGVGFGCLFLPVSGLSLLGVVSVVSALGSGGGSCVSSSEVVAGV